MIIIIYACTRRFLNQCSHVWSGCHFLYVFLSFKTRNVSPTSQFWKMSHPTALVAQPDWDVSALANPFISVNSPDMDVEGHGRVRNLGTDRTCACKLHKQWQLKMSVSPHYYLCLCTSQMQRQLLEVIVSLLTSFSSVPFLLTGWKKLYKNNMIRFIWDHSL
jgi:hypothetical protein